MPQAKNGDRVKVHYTGSLDNGDVFDTSVGREPLQFIIGEGMLIPAFEAAVSGMSPGESKTIKIPAPEAYGPHIKELLIEFERQQLPRDINPEIGLELQIEQEDGNVAIVRIAEVTESKVAIDANHPLAGKDLTFDIQLLEVA